MNGVRQLPRAADVAAIRLRMGLSQSAFADMLGISLRTLQGWEALRREPDGPARVLLRIADECPEVFARALGESITRGRK